MLHRFFKDHSQARNAAVEHLETPEGPLGADYEPVEGKFGDLKGERVGVRSTKGEFRRLRKDFDPEGGDHYNVEKGKGKERTNTHFWWGDKYDDRGPT